MTKQLKATITADTSDFERPIERARKKSQGLNQQLEKTGRASQKAAGGLGGARRVAGQLGFQVQDMAVQLQSGTNALVVFGQQGSQVASIFGPTGAVIGAIIAVGAALANVLVPSLLATNKATDDAFGELNNYVEELRQMSVAQINDEMTTMNENLEEQRSLLNRLKLQRNVDQYAAAADVTQDLNKQIENQTELVDKLTVKYNTFNAALGILAERGNEASNLFTFNQEEDADAHILQFEEFEKARIALQAKYFIERFNQEQSQQQQLAQNNRRFLEQQAQEGEMFANQELEREQKLAADKKRAQAKFWSDATSLMSSSSRKMFEIGKIAAISEAIISTHQGVAASLKMGMPWAAPFAAATLAAGVARVQAIKSQKFGGGGSGGAAVGGGGASGGGQPTSGQGVTPTDVNLSIRGDVFGREQLINLSEQLNELNRDGVVLGSINVV